MHDKLLRYEQLKQLEKQIEEDIQTIGEEIKAEFIKQGVDESPQLEFGKITLCGRTSYTYSGIAQNLEAQLKRQRADEVANGTADTTVIQYLKYVRSRNI